MLFDYIKFAFFERLKFFWGFFNYESLKICSNVLNIRYKNNIKNRY